MIYASHITTSKGSGTWWSYDAVRRSIHLAFKHGAVDVDVCAPHAPRPGAFEIERLDPLTWRIMPVRYTAQMHLEARAIHDRIGIDTVILLDTPEEIARELSDLGASHA